MHLFTAYDFVCTCIHTYVYNWVLFLFSCTDPELNNRLSEVYQQLGAIEADKAPAKAGMILAGLGFTTSMQKQTTRLVYP